MDTRCPRKIWNCFLVFFKSSLKNPPVKACPVKHFAVYHSLKRSSSKSCCHLPLIPWLFFPQASTFVFTLTVLPSQWIHPKFNYFWGGFRKRDGALSQHSRGSELAPRNTSQSHAQTVWQIYDRDFNALVQLARWTLRWRFIRISNFISLLLCHTLLGVYIEGPLSFFPISDVSWWRLFLCYLGNQWELTGRSNYGQIRMT